MKPLSPAAQAVMDAIKIELDHAPWELSFLAGSCAAAVLRAAAHRMEFVQDVQRLFAIAAELDPLPTTTTETAHD